MKKSLKFSCFVLASTVPVMFSVVMFSTKQYRNNFLKSNAEVNDYRLELTSEKNVLTNATTLSSGVANTITEAGQGTVTFSYENIKKDVGVWATFEDGEVYNITAINDMKQMEIVLASGSIDVLFGTTNSDAVMYTSQTTVSSSDTISVPSGTSHFKVIAESASITSLTIYYECTSAIETDSSSLNFKGDGSVNYPYEISNLAEWNKFVSISSDNNFSGKNFKLMDNIGPITNKIGSYGTGFSGIFDGNGHTVTVNWNYDTGTANQGFVGHLNAGGVVKNLTLNGTLTINRTDNDAKIGSFVGVLSGGSVLNCTSNVAITTKGFCVGGIVGISDNTASYVQNCINNGDITDQSTTTANHTIGGIVGIASSKITIEDCRNNGDIHGTGVQIGGIIGKSVSSILNNCENYGEISTTSNNTNTGNTGIAGIAGLAGTASVFTSCKNYGDVTGSCSMVGGLAGKFDGTSKLISCANYADITGLDQVGGMAGRNYGSSSTSFTLIKECINEGTVKATNNTTTTQAGGMSGYAQFAEFEDCINGSSSDSSKGSVSTPNSTGKATENHGAGGIAGFVNEVTYFSGCVNYGTISSAGSEVGGIGGKCVKAVFTSCINNGSLTGYIYVGGICGRAVTNCSFTNNTNHGNITVTNHSAAATAYGQIYGDTAQSVTDGGGNTGDGTITVL